MNDTQLALILLEGESQKHEFKEKISNLDREMVAFANSSGGTVFVGINGSGKVIGTAITNRLKSQVVDIARNCDPSLSIEMEELHHEQVLAIHIPRGVDRPYRCKEGFYVRNGPNTQKLKRNEIIALINEAEVKRFDESINNKFQYPRDFSKEALEEYLKTCGIKTNASDKDILISLNVVEETQEQLLFNNAGVLFFAKDPQRILPESFVTAIKYQSHDRFSILDKKDITGSPIQQITDTIAFALRHMSMEPVIEMHKGPYLGAHKKIFEYPVIAIREAIVNAIAHRDYFYDSSHIYVHMFPDYIEIESPGGLFRGLTIDSLGKRSVRRNRLIADLLHRAGFIERVGSGFHRMEHTLSKNNNPPLEVSVSNFFNIRFYKRFSEIKQEALTSRQQKIYRLIEDTGSIEKKDVTVAFRISEDTALRELNTLISLGLIRKEGTGKATRYLKSS